MTDYSLSGNKMFAFQDERTGVLPVRAGRCRLLPDAPTAPMYTGDCEATKAYVASLAAEMHANGPCTK